MSAESWTQFFDQTKLPDDYDRKCADISAFVKRNEQLGRRVVLVTSGGTTVPLESRTVRYIDNFSVGTRGATSTEYFLQHGYAVLFLHRRGSLEPFKHRINKLNILDILEVQSADIKVKADFCDVVRPVLQRYQQYQQENCLLSVSYSTLSDYLYLLKAAAQVLATINDRAMFYLAAAVSDFYIPAQQMPEHKIQSGAGALNISLQLVPKMLQPLVNEWAPNAYIVSFKLETDQSILISKARAALRKYKHQIVVANILDTRKREVVMVTDDQEHHLRLTDEDMMKGVEIESQIVPELIHRHSKFSR